MYKITEEIYAKLYKEMDETEKPKFVWKLSTSKPSENFIIMKTMVTAHETRIFEIESEFQVEDTAKKKEILKAGSAKTTAIIDLLESICDFSNARYQFKNLDLDKLMTLFYEWWSFCHTSEEEENVFL